MTRGGRRWIMGVVGAYICLLLCSGTSLAENLYEAAEKGNLAAVRRLVGQGANVNARYEDSETPLHAAADKGHKDVVMFLIEKGGEVNAYDKRYWTPLHHAAMDKGDPKEVVEILIKNGADVNAGKKYGEETPLHYAAEYGNKYVAELLIANGADVNAKTKRYGYTPIYEAARSTYSHYGVLELLIANGADVNVRTKGGKTPLQAALLPYAKELLRRYGGK
jgi:ankyrin repeat protein